MTRAEEEKPMNREQVEKAARAYFEELDTDLVPLITDFALAMMKKQREAGSRKVAQRLKCPKGGCCDFWYDAMVPYGYGFWRCKKCGN